VPILKGPFAHHLGLYHGSFGNPLRSRLRIPATILSATPFFNAALRRAKNLKDAFLMVGSLNIEARIARGL
jgi:hypothetical protein